MESAQVALRKFRPHTDYGWQGALSPTRVVEIRSPLWKSWLSYRTIYFTSPPPHHYSWLISPMYTGIPPQAHGGSGYHWFSSMICELQVPDIALVCNIRLVMILWYNLQSLSSMLYRAYGLVHFMITPFRKHARVFVVILLSTINYNLVNLMEIFRSMKIDNQSGIWMEEISD